VPAVPGRARVSADAVAEAVRVLRSGEPTVIFLGNRGLRAKELDLASRIAAKTGARLLSQTFVGRIERGAGRVSVDRLPYPVEQGLKMLEGVKHLVLVGAKDPVAFFAYPNKPSRFAPADTQVHRLAAAADDILHALEWLADELGARTAPASVTRAERPGLATGAINPMTLGQSVGALLPENVVVVDEAVTTGRGFFAPTKGAPPHDWLTNMGGSIGIGMPLAVGAAIACPDRKVLNLQADGSGMYTVQALWTQARENLDITTVIFANRSYAILRLELANVGAENVGRKALDMLDLGRPDLDWVALARGMGVPGARVTTMEEFNARLAEGLKTKGPYLIEAVL